MIKHIAFLLLVTAFTQKTLAGVISTPQTQPLNLSQSLLKYHKYDLSVNLAIKPKRAVSIISLSKPMEFQLKCGEFLVGSNGLLFDDTMSGKIFTLTIVARNVRLKCPSSAFTLVINPNGVELDTDLSAATYKIEDLGEDTEGFIQRVNRDELSYASDLIYYHSQMAISISNRTSLHCLIKGYESDELLEEVVHDLKIQYKNFFGLDYLAGDIDCNNTISLATQIAACASNTRTPFCSNYRLYTEAKSWFVENLALSAQLLAQIPATLTDLQNELKKVEERMQGTLDRSLAQTAPKTSNNL